MSPSPTLFASMEIQTRLKQSDDRTFDKFFDCLNVRSPAEHIKKRKENLKLYKSATDERLLVNVFLITLLILYL